MHFLNGISYYFIFIISTSVQASDRCNYAETPFHFETIWKYEGENVTFICPGYEADPSLSYSVEYVWYEEEYNCNLMTRIYASYVNHIRGSSRVITKHPERMTIDKTSGELTITNLTSADEMTLTCIFMRLEEQIASVHLKIKDFQGPVLTGLSTSLEEDEVRVAECVVREMHPTQGFIQVNYQGKIIKAINLAEGSILSPLIFPITGEAKAEGDKVTCLAVQNVSGSVRQLSASADVTVHYSYHTRAVSSLPDVPMEFSNVTLSCEITREGNPKEISEYTWIKNGNEIALPAKPNITLSDVTEVDTGSYQCLIINKPGITTLLKDAQELQLNIVTLKCLPELDFNRDHIRLGQNTLMVSWATVYSTNCKYDLPIELVIQLQGENETAKQSTAIVTEKYVTINGHYDRDKNYQICLSFKNFPKKKYCANIEEEQEWEKSEVGESKSNSMERTGLIVGYTILGCVALAVIIGVVFTMMPKLKQRQNRVIPIEEDPYEDLDPSQLKEANNPSLCGRSDGTDDHPGGRRQAFEQLDSIYGMMQGIASLPNPPPLPDFGDLNGSGPLEQECPEEEQHYNNQATIMATMPRRKPIKVLKTQSLDDLIEYCKGSYHDETRTSLTEKEPDAPEDYMDMRGVAKDMDDESAEN